MKCSFLGVFVLTIQYVEENILNLYPEAIVHPVNCIGICRNALSKQLKKAYAGYFREYTRTSIRKQLGVFDFHVIPLGTLFGTQFIITAPIRYHWQEKLSPPMLRKSLQILVSLIIKSGFTTIALPTLPAGAPSGWLEGELQKNFQAQDPQKDYKILLFNQDSI